MPLNITRIFTLAVLIFGIAVAQTHAASEGATQTRMEKPATAPIPAERPMPAPPPPASENRKPDPSEKPKRNIVIIYELLGNELGTTFDVLSQEVAQLRTSLEVAEKRIGDLTAYGAACGDKPGCWKPVE